MSKKKFMRLKAQVRALIIEFVARGFGSADGRLADRHPAVLMPRRLARQAERWRLMLELSAELTLREWHLFVAAEYYGGDRFDSNSWRRLERFCDDRTNDKTDPQFLPADYGAIAFSFGVKKRWPNALASLEWNLYALSEKADLLLKTFGLDPLPTNACDHARGVLLGDVKCHCDTYCVLHPYTSPRVVARRHKREHLIESWLNRIGWPNGRLTKLGWPNPLGATRYRPDGSQALVLTDCIDWVAMCGKIAASRWLFSALSPEAQDMVRSAARHYSEKWRQDARKTRKRESPPLGIQFVDDPQRLLDELNELLERPNLVPCFPRCEELTAWSEVRLLLETRLVRNLTVAETVRLNRLLLEEDRGSHSSQLKFHGTFPPGAVLACPRVYPVEHFVYRAVIGSDKKARELDQSILGQSASVLRVATLVCRSCGKLARKHLTGCTCGEEDWRPKDWLIQWPTTDWEPVRVGICRECKRFFELVPGDGDPPPYCPPCTATTPPATKKPNGKTMRIWWRL